MHVTRPARTLCPHPAQWLPRARALALAALVDLSDPSPCSLLCLRILRLLLRPLLCPQYDVRTDDITMIAIYLEDMSNLQAAHEQEINELAAAVEGEENATKKRQSLREMRRKSTAVAPSSLDIAMKRSKNIETTEAEKIVRRVMTKEKRKAVLAATSAEDAIGAEARPAEGKFNYKEGETVSAGEVAEIKKAVSTNFLLGHLSESQKEEARATVLRHPLRHPSCHHPMHRATPPATTPPATTPSHLRSPRPPHPARSSRPLTPPAHPACPRCHRVAPGLRLDAAMPLQRGRQDH